MLRIKKCKDKAATKNHKNEGEFTMKITAELKEKLDAAKTAEEKKLIAEAGVELTDEKIEKVAGGEDWQDGGSYEISL